MILRHDGYDADPPISPVLSDGRFEVEPPDELELAKLAVLQLDRTDGSPGRVSWARRHPLALGAGLLIAGLLIGRSRVLGGLIAGVAALAARAAAQRLTANILRNMRV